MTDDRDIVREWASLESKLKAARRETLKQAGHTETSYRELRRDAATHLKALGSEFVPTEYGAVILDRSPIYAHKNSKQIDESITIHLREE